MTIIDVRTTMIFCSNKMVHTINKFSTWLLNDARSVSKLWEEKLSNELKKLFKHKLFILEKFRVRDSSCDDMGNCDDTLSNKAADF